MRIILLLLVLLLGVAGCNYNLSINDPYYIPKIEYRIYKPKKEILLIVPNDLYPEEATILKENLNLILLDFCQNQAPILLKEDVIYTDEPTEPYNNKSNVASSNITLDTNKDTLETTKSTDKISYESTNNSLLYGCK